LPGLGAEQRVTSLQLCEHLSGWNHFRSEDADKLETRFVCHKRFLSCLRMSIYYIKQFACDIPALETTASILKHFVNKIIVTNKVSSPVAYVT
jgi:hypothetical protein